MSVYSNKVNLGGWLSQPWAQRLPLGRIETRGRDDDLSTLLRHSADDEDEGDEVDLSRLIDAESSHSGSSEMILIDQRYPLRKSRSARRSTSVSTGMSDRALSPAKTKQVGRGEMKMSRSQSGRMSSGPHKYAPEKYSDRESVTPRSATLPSASRSASRRTSEASSNLNSNKISSRPNSAANRPRSNTVNTLSSSPRGNLNKTTKAPQISAATTVQKNWRGHMTRSNDDRVQELKEEVRNLRTEQHIRHLTKELTAAKLALERERKLRALQMDAIKVLWKEVQLMDDRTKSDNDNNGTAPVGNGPGRQSGLSRARPSGSSGSKISSRQSEHSIAKLVETLEATAGTGLSTNRSKDTDFIPSNATTPATPANVMVQSMPPSLLASSGVTAANSRAPPGDSDAVEALSRTCNNLQRQVEMLQSSLSGVMHFMSTFTAFDAQQQLMQQRTRHSSAASTNQDSFCYYPTGPMSLPLITSMDSCGYPAPVSMSASIDGGQVQHHPAYDRTSCAMFVQPNDNSGVSMSRSCDCLTQTDISAVITPKNEMPPNNLQAPFPFLHLKRVDIPLDSSGESDAPNSSSFTSKQQISQAKRRERSRSPRPQTLPGLVREGEKQHEDFIAKIPGLAQLAGTALLNSPQAPEQVKAFARNLVEGLLSDTIAKQGSSDVDNDNEDDKATNNEETDVSLSLAAEDETEPCNTGDASNAKATTNKDDTQPSSPKEGNTSKDSLTVGQIDEDTSSHVDTDSLEDNNVVENDPVRTEENRTCYSAKAEKQTPQSG